MEIKKVGVLGCGLMGAGIAQISAASPSTSTSNTGLAAARKLINDCGYHRRDEELADAEEAAKTWGTR